MIIIGVEPTGKPKEDFLRFQGYARSGRNCLFLYDNLAEPTLSSCLPSRSIPVDILVTTRRLLQSSYSILNLQLPTKANAMNILCKGAPFLKLASDNSMDLKGKDLEYAEKIVGPSGVDRLPLALHHIQAFAREDSEDTTMRELWECIENKRSLISLDPRSLEEWLQHYRLKSLIPDLASLLGVSSLDNLRSLSTSAIEESSLENEVKVLLVKAKTDLLERPSVGPWRLDIERVCSDKSRACRDIPAVASLLPSQHIYISLLQECVAILSKSGFSRIKFNSDLRQIENVSLMTCSRSETDYQESTLQVHPFVQDTIKQCVVPAGELLRYLCILCEVLLQLLPSLDDVRMERGLNSPSVVRHSSDLYYIADIDIENADEQKAWREVLDLGCVLALRLQDAAIAKSLCQKRLRLERNPQSRSRPLGVVLQCMPTVSCLVNRSYLCLFAVLAVTAVAYSLDQSKECYDLIDEALELLKYDPPVGDEEEVEQWALDMCVCK